MINSVIYEIILVALMILFPKSNEGTFQVMDKSGNAVTYSYVMNENESSILEGAHDFIVTSQETGEKSRFEFIDNALYRVYPDANNENINYELDILQYVSKLHHDKILKTKLSIKTLDKKDTVLIGLKDNNLEIKLKKNKTAIIIDKSLLE